MILFYSHEGELAYLSNFYISNFEIDGIVFDCVERYMHFMKARVFKDKKMAEKILQADTPASCKKYGRQVKGFNATIWNGLKQLIVFKGCFEKFRQNPEIREKLLSTGDEILAEASPWDGIWGIKKRATPAALDIDNWNGSNLLGFTLMAVREELRKPLD